MKRFDLNNTFQAACVVSDKARTGEIYHVARNSAGGARLTPVARVFVWQPEFVEGFHKHWRVDCFLRAHKLSPAPIQLGDWLVAALVREGLCVEPIWMSPHRSDELKGRAYGGVFSEG